MSLYSRLYQNPYMDENMSLYSRLYQNPYMDENVSLYLRLYQTSYMNGKYDTLRFYITLIHSVLKKRMLQQLLKIIQTKKQRSSATCDHCFMSLYSILN